MTKPKIQISWSGGKDSALALYRLQQSNIYDIVGIHTVIEKDTKRVGIHGVPESLIDAQAVALQLPLTKLYLPKKPLAYEKLMKDYYHNLSSEGVSCVMFGDIFLEDLKDFREQLLKPSQMKGVYPLWKENTTLLVNEFLDSGFKSRLCAVDAKYIDSDYVGEFLSREFIADHISVDACGENGEYHSIVVDGPLFKKKLHLEIMDKYEEEYTFKVKNKEGVEKLQKECFYYADFALVDNN